jgi:hypothetical protein
METFPGPTSYTTGGSTMQSRVLRMIERAAALQVTGGYIGEVVTGSITGNSFKLKFYFLAVSGAATGGLEVPAGTSMIGSVASTLIEGF